SLKGGLYASYAIFDPVPPHMSGWIPLATGLAALETLEDFSIGARLKWPNDILVDGLKIGGILSHGVKRGEKRCYVVGTGINVNNDAPLKTAVSMKDVLEKEPDLDEVTTSFVNHVVETLSSMKEEASVIYNKYRDSCSTINRQVEVNTSQGLVEGTAVGINDDGALVVDSNGNKKIILAGDCLHVD
ncbi:MAG TPA: biotin--[acetyl-CoA-carboxylase] ligase, partial [Euryarchaeota archaeon]|nr:biotin--[acetyl-CoA-carboxylase] ligase [Euryarchaeota archaeon]